MAKGDERTIVIDVSELVDADIMGADDLAKAIVEYLPKVTRYAVVKRAYTYNVAGSMEKIVEKAESGLDYCSNVVLVDRDNVSVVQICYLK